MAKYLLKNSCGRRLARAEQESSCAVFKPGLKRSFERIRNAYRGLLEGPVFRPPPLFFAGAFLGRMCAPPLGSIRGWDKIFFPSVDSGEFTLHLRAPTSVRFLMFPFPDAGGSGSFPFRLHAAPGTRPVTHLMDDPDDPGRRRVQRPRARAGPPLFPGWDRRARPGAGQPIMEAIHPARPVSSIRS